MLIPRRSALFDASYSALVLRDRSPVECSFANDAAKDPDQAPNYQSDKDIGAAPQAFRCPT